MAKLSIWLLIVTFIVTACNHVDVTRYVDPNIGGVVTLLTTKNPTVHRPHGMIRVLPVTKPGLSDRYLSDKIYGFAVNMPTYRNGHVTELMATKGTISSGRAANASVYDHDLEEVHSWHHKVWLEDSNIIADWTTTERSVIYRFNFQDKEPAHIIFRSSGTALFVVNDQNSIKGWEESNNTKQYFNAQFSSPFNSSGTFTAGKTTSDNREISGREVGTYHLLIHNCQE